MRGFHALLHGDIGRVLQLNVMLLPGLIYFALLVLLELSRPHNLRAERLYRHFSGRTASWIIFAIIVAWGIGRNLI